MTSNVHFSFKCFPMYAFVSKIFPKLSGLLIALCVNGLKSCLVGALLTAIGQNR